MGLKALHLFRHLVFDLSWSFYAYSYLTGYYVKTIDFPIVFSGSVHFWYKNKYTKKKESPQHLHKLCGFPHDGPILEMAAFPKNVNLTMLQFQVQNSDRVIKSTWIP
jgi:hypothetical protein